jgi:Cu+-exporting ATPase
MMVKPVIFLKGRDVFLRYAFVLIAVTIPLICSSAFSEMVAMHEHHHTDHGADMQMKDMQMMKGPEVIVDLETAPAELKAGTGAQILFSIKDTDGKPLQDLTITHDRLVHVIVASADFNVFAHIHPDDFGPITDEMKKKAEYPMRFTFPKAGKYIIAIDSAVKDMPFSEHFTVDVGGGPRMGPYTKDLSPEKKFGDLSVTLSTAPEKITAGKEATLKYVVRKDGEPVTDLEPFLSAPMHVAIISSDLDNFIHEHGELPGAPMGHDHMGHMIHMNTPNKFGPEIDVTVVFPVKGLFQIFSQVGYKGKVVVLSFMVEVQ